MYFNFETSKGKIMKVIPTTTGRKINSYSPQQNPNFGKAIIVKSKNSKLLDMLEHIDFLFWSKNKPNYKYTGNIALDAYKNEGNENAVFEGLLTDGTEANTLRRFVGLIKKAFFNEKDKEYDKLVRRESKFLNKAVRKANDAGDVIEITSIEDLLKLPMLQEDKVQIKAFLEETFPTEI